MICRLDVSTAASTWGSSARIRRSITGTATSTRARSVSTLRSVAAGSKRGATTVVAQRVMPNIRWDMPQAWNSGAATTCVSRGRRGMRSSTAATAGSAPAEAPRVAPFGRPVVPLVRMITRPWWRTGVVRSPLVAIAASGGAVDDRRPVDLRGLGGERAVVDDDRDALGGDDVGQLRTGEAGVQQHDVGAGLAHPEQGVGERPVVARQHADGDARRRAELAHPGGDALGAPPQLPVGDGPVGVDDRRPARVALDGEGQRRGRRGTPRQGGGEPGEQPVGPLEHVEVGSGERAQRSELAGHGHRGTIPIGLSCAARRSGSPPDDSPPEARSCSMAGSSAPAWKQVFDAAERTVGAASTSSSAVRTTRSSSASPPGCSARPPSAASGCPGSSCTWPTSRPAATSTGCWPRSPSSNARSARCASRSTTRRRRRRPTTRKVASNGASRQPRRRARQDSA